MNVNSNEPVFFPCSIKTSKCSGSCNNINDPYATINNAGMKINVGANAKN